MQEVHLCSMENKYHFNLIADAIRYIAGHYPAQPKLEDIAEQVHLSPYHFQRLFQSWAGVSPKQFLQFLTTEHAKKCLLAGHSTLETAYLVGLSGNGRLHDLFLKVKACTPGEFKERGQGLAISYQVIETPFGPALVAETSVGICKVAFLEEEDQPEAILQDEFPNALLHRASGNNIEAVRHYFQNWAPPNGKIELDLKGTPFQIQVWQALLSIPPAQLVSYQDIANLIKKPGAVRAVGTAIGQNPVAYLIPCHRVIRQTGQMGGYRWGAGRKMAINGYESAVDSQQSIVGSR